MAEAMTTTDPAQSIASSSAGLVKVWEADD
jgi:hypothetical protein